MYAWYFSDMDEVPLTKVLEFITGADRIPPLGFKNQIKVCFFSRTEDEINRGVWRLPFASTCGMEVHLPRGINDVDQFTSLMNRAILECCGFGKI